SVILAAGGRHRVMMNCDLRVVRDDQFPFALHHFTGSKEHNVALRTMAQQKGIKINEYEIVGPKGPIAAKDESDIYRYFGMDYSPPEMRENTGELDLAELHKLPKLVELSDLRGTFHNHTTESDGRNSLEEMVEAARALGLEYLGIGDHSQSL